MLLNSYIEKIDSNSILESVDCIDGDPFEFLTNTYYESILVDSQINQAIIACEYAYLKDTGNELVTEAGGEGFLAMVKKIFKAIRDFIASIFKKICEFFKSLFSKTKESAKKDEKEMAAASSEMDTMKKKVQAATSTSAPTQVYSGSTALATVSKSSSDVATTSSRGSYGSSDNGSTAIATRGNKPSNDDKSSASSKGSTTQKPNPDDYDVVNLDGFKYRGGNTNLSFGDYLSSATDGVRGFNATDRVKTIINRYKVEDYTKENLNGELDDLKNVATESLGKIRQSEDDMYDRLIPEKSAGAMNYNDIKKLKSEVAAVMNAQENTLTKVFNDIRDFITKMNKSVDDSESFINKEAYSVLQKGLSQEQQQNYSTFISGVVSSMKAFYSQASTESVKLSNICTRINRDNYLGVKRLYTEATKLWNEQQIEYQEKLNEWKRNK